MNNIYDCIIIGGGIAGLTAAIYAARGGLQTIIIEKNQLGGQIVNSHDVSNYPGFSNISGYELIENIKEQAISFGVEIIYEEVVEVQEKKVITKKSEYDAKTIIIATGLKRRSLGIEEKYIGSGVSYCATCDGNFYKDRDVLVVGGGNTALEDALYLSNIANKVYLVHRRESFRGDKYLVDKVRSTNNIEIIYNANLKSINGNNMVESVTLDNGNTINVSGVFIAIGNETSNELVSNLLEVDSDGYIISDDTTTKYPNIFVAGDTRTSELKQLVTAASDGALAASKCINHLNTKC